MLWELLFMMVILKIPVAYLCLVVYWAVRAEPRPVEGAALAARTDTPTGPTGRTRVRQPSRRRSIPPRPGGRAARIAARAATARARRAR